MGASLKCHYTNAGSTDNKEEQLEVCVWLQGCYLIGIMETWWNRSHDWSAAVEGYRLFRKDRLGRQGEGVALCVREQLECTGLCLGTGWEPVESLWVKISGQANTGAVVVGIICYRLPDQEVDEAFFKELKESSSLWRTTLISAGRTIH